MESMRGYDKELYPQFISYTLSKSIDLLVPFSSIFWKSINWISFGNQGTLFNFFFKEHDHQIALGNFFLKKGKKCNYPHYHNGLS